jgi:serine/threonine protein kinase
MSQQSWIGYEIGGRYVIEEQLGAGGMSTVFRATDPNLRRPVAIKLIHTHLSSNEEFVRRFEEEAAAVAQLNHPNIIKVYDFNHDGDLYYMVLEYVPGETLKDRLKRLNKANRHMGTEEVVDIAASICDAVDYAHKHSMIHRDIKPANVMLSTQGRAVLMDFGVAKILGGQQHTATGAVIGTAAYMSPEQARGERPDERSDIYSLGVMLFEMVSGRPPFEADSAMTTMMMHVSDPVPDLDEIAPGTPVALKRICEKALEKDRENRYQTAAQMAAALRNALTQQEEAAPEMTFIESAEPAPDSTLIEEAMAPESTFVEQAPAAPSQPTPPPTPPPTSRTATATRPAAETGQRTVAAPAKTGSSGGGGVPVVLFGIGGLAVLGIVVIAVILGSSLLRGVGGGDGTADNNNGGGEQPVAEVDATQEPATEIPVVAEEPTATEAAPAATAAPTNTPEPAYTPTPTDPADLYVRITNITLDGNTYVVDYETFNFTPLIAQGYKHIHFYFDTVPVEQAGVPGNGPWVLYDVPSPFRGLTTGAKPADATQICARVANDDHSLYSYDSGNCWYLPDVTQ